MRFAEHWIDCTVTSLRDVTPGIREFTLKPDDAARLRCEGRNAAFAGLSARSCPYATSSRAKREAWLEGYHTSK